MSRHFFYPTKWVWEWRSAGDEQGADLSIHYYSADSKKAGSAVNQSGDKNDQDDKSDIDGAKGNETLLNWINEEIQSLKEEQFFHKDYDETLVATYGEEYKEELVVEGAKIK